MGPSSLCIQGLAFNLLLLFLGCAFHFHVLFSANSFCVAVVYAYLYMLAAMQRSK